MTSITKAMTARALDSGVNLDEPCEITVPDLGRRFASCWFDLRRYAHTQTADHDDAGIP